MSIRRSTSSSTKMIFNNDKLRVLTVVSENSEAEKSIRDINLSLYDFIFEPSTKSAFMRLREDTQFDIILLELTTDALEDSLAFTRDIRSNEHFVSVPVLGLTATDDLAILAEFSEHGGIDFITLPLSRNALFLRLEMARRHGLEEKWLLERARRLAKKVEQRDSQIDDLRRFAQDIVSGINAVLLVLDAELTILFANEVFYSINSQIDKTKVVGGSVIRFLSSMSIKRGLPERISNVATTGHAVLEPRYNDVFYGREKNIWHLQITPIIYGETRQILLLAEDVTERALVENRLDNEREMLQKVVDATGSTLALCDINAVLLWSNRTFIKTFGDEAEPARRAAFWQRIYNGPVSIGAAVDSGGTLVDSWVFTAGDGAVHQYKNMIVPLYKQTEAGGRKSEALILTQDLTREEIHGRQLMLLREMWELMGSILNLESLFHVIMVSATSGSALGFNRAFLFIRDVQENSLKGYMAVGPASREDAFRIWSHLSSRVVGLIDMLREAEHSVPKPSDQPLYHLIKDLSYPLNKVSNILVRAALEKKPIVIRDAEKDPRVSRDFFDRFQAREFIVAPLISKGAIMGVLLADNVYNGRSVSDEHLNLLSLFAGLAGLAIENAMTFDELKKTMDSLQVTQDKLLHSEKLATIGRLAAHVAHEIRNPLATIGGFATSIAKHPEKSERVKQNAEIIVEEAIRLENILKTVMDFSRPTKPVFVRSNFNRILNDCLPSIKPELDANGIRLIMELDPSLPDREIDPNQFKQVLINLSKNASQAMASNSPGAERRLTIRSSADGEHTIIEIEDTGCGIPESRIDQLFSPFFTTKSDGTGLGLAIVQQIVVEHGGTIDVESEEGKGTIFTIRL